ncbi:TPA: hypothetical protein IAA82_06590 [Candidatus Galligastranaerophilus gallistercoris]|nr:hypothetical protein [Candidatus Galligastranaerophilus gallistercoris]
MKKAASFIFIFCTLIAFCAPVFALDPVYENDKVIYDTKTKCWSKEENKEGIILYKKTSSGTGSYSIYYYKCDKPAFQSSSNFEFIDDKKLIAVDNASLKYSKIIFDGSKFIQIPLEIEELKTIFPDVEIIKISRFKNNKLTIKKPLFEKKTVLLVNDTDEFFHKYFVSPESSANKNIKGLITLSKKFTKVKFCHLGEKDGLTIYIK